MATIAVLGAGGVTGRRLVAALGERGHEVATVPSDAPDRTAALRPLDLLVIAVREPALRAAWLSAAVHAGVHAVDAGADATVAVHAYDDLDAAARAAGVVAVPSAGAAVADLLAATAASAVSRPDEVHVAWSFPDRGGWRRAVAPGYRAAAASALAAPFPVVYGGHRQQERAGEARRLAWFPKPIGPAHAAAVPGPEPLTVPRHAPGVEVVRTYLAVTAWRAELLQATASAACSPRWRAFLTRRFEQGDAPVTGAGAARWACVAESRGVEGIARAWAYGRDAVELGVRSVVALTDAIVAGRSDAGVLPPARVEVPSTLLDQLSVSAVLRWSVSRPSSPAGVPNGDPYGG